MSKETIIGKGKKKKKKMFSSYQFGRIIFNVLQLHVNSATQPKLSLYYTCVIKALNEEVYWRYLG